MALKAPQNIPTSSGCYIFKDKDKKPLYVGKAKNLKARVKTYFSGMVSEKIRSLRNEAREIEFVITNSEWEAFLLENNFIKQFHPKYNVLLRDDKTYPFIKVTVNHPFPKAIFTRRMEKDKSLYFGPFVPSSYAKKNLKIIQDFFGVATCKDPLDQSRIRPCLLYEMGRCLAPCVKDKISKEKYRKRVEEAILFLSGKNDELIKVLEERMKESSLKQEYESAANYRDLLNAAKSLSLKQSIVTRDEGHLDFYALYGEDDFYVIENFIVLKGKVVERKSFTFERVELDRGELFETALTQIYSSSDFIPEKVYVSEQFEGLELVSKFLSEKKGKKVEVLVPKAGVKRELIKTLLKNCESNLKRRETESAILKPLSDFLNLNQKIKRIECFDASHYGGEVPYVSMVLWEEGKFVKRGYRKFSLHEAKGGDDYAALKEAVFRRYKRVKEENDLFPDLILIDGGANQASSALQSLKELQIENIPVLGLAKKNEELFLPSGREPLPFEKSSQVLLVLRKIRDEAHRFAIKASSKKLLDKRLSPSFAKIEGVGEKSAKKLLRHFLTTDNLLKASEEELTKVVGRRISKKIVRWRDEKK